MKFNYKIAESLMNEHEGAVAFEYIIILIIMTVAIFAGFNQLQKQITAKATDVSTFIQNNGQSELGKSGAGK